MRFWKDTWCENIPLCEAFQSLFALVVSQDVWVVDCWDSVGDEGGWIPCFSRSFNDLGGGGGGKAPFDPSRKEACCWFGG